MVLEDTVVVIKIKNYEDRSMLDALSYKRNGGFFLRHMLHISNSRQIPINYTTFIRLR